MDDPRDLTPDQLREHLNRWPTFAAQRITVEEIAPDWTRAVVRADLTPENANFFGTAFGGTLFSMIDPFVVILAAQQLGPAYVVWDKAVEIDFLRPGTGPVTARVEMPVEQVERLREETAEGKRVLRVFPVDLVADDGTVVARQERTLYVRRLDPGAEA
ncbi:DUF4442 domain-containing protein [Nocardioides solisilvae]|uniref:DUF4442 domain-containing protein n=1 Tax=Nocardioides solisilvae TaxID=1542435 RepID=UPI0013A56FB2|nr:DUF4442 domain-containing protein [Nocardioides solisilvae]